MIIYLIFFISISYFNLFLDMATVTNQIQLYYFWLTRISKGYFLASKQRKLLNFAYFLLLNWVLIVFGAFLELIISNKNNFKLMSTEDQQMLRPRLDHIKLPKLSSYRKFRIRSASKQKLQNIDRVVTNKKSQKPNQLYFSNDKYRSNSLKSTQSRKSVTKKSQANNSSDQQILEARSCKFNSKICNKNGKEILEKQHQRNMERLRQIALLFDPKRIMRMGRKNSQCSHEQSRRQTKHKHVKGQFRMNQYIFEGKQNKGKKNSDVGIADQYWRKVNQSLILAPCKTAENDQVSKDLRQIYQTLVTQ